MGTSLCIFGKTNRQLSYVTDMCKVWTDMILSLASPSSLMATPMAFLAKAKMLQTHYIYYGKIYTDYHPVHMRPSNYFETDSNRFGCHVLASRQYQIDFKPIWPKPTFE